MPQILTECLMFYFSSQSFIQDVESLTYTMYMSMTSCMKNYPQKALHNRAPSTFITASELCPPLNSIHTGTLTFQIHFTHPQNKVFFSPDWINLGLMITMGPIELPKLFVLWLTMVKYVSCWALNGIMFPCNQFFHGLRQVDT